MKISRRSFLGYVFASIVAKPLKIDAPRFLKPTDRNSLVRNKVLEAYHKVWQLSGTEKELGAKIELDLGMDDLDFVELIMHIEEDFDFDLDGLFDRERIETGEDLVLCISYLEQGKEVPLGLLNRERGRDEIEIIETNCRLALRALAADPEEQLVSLGDWFCPGCSLTDYHAEWLRRTADHPSMSALKGEREVRELLKAIAAIPKHEKACIFAPSDEESIDHGQLLGLLERPSWGMVRTAARLAEMRFSV